MKDLVGVVNLYREDRAKALNLTQVCYKEKDISHMLKSASVQDLNVDRIQKLSKMLELCDELKP